MSMTKRPLLSSPRVVRSQSIREENDSLRTGPRQAAGLVEDARKNVTRRSQNAITAYVGTSNAQAMPIRSHGPRMELRKLPRHCRRRNECHLPRYLPTTQGAVSATAYIFHTVNQLRSHIQSRVCPMEAIVLEADPPVSTNRSANRCKTPISFKLRHVLTRRLPGHQVVGARPGLNHHDTNQSTHPHLHLHLHHDNTTLMCIIIHRRA
jgi:hypothetical protein